MSAPVKRDEKPIGGWICSCTPETALPLSTRNCPNCNRPLSQSLLDKVYKQVLAELRQDFLQRTSERWKRRERRSISHRKAFLIIMALGALIWAVFMFALHRGFFVQRLAPVGAPFVTMGSRVIGDLGEFFSTLIEKLTPIFRFPITLIQAFIHSVRDLLRFIF